VVEAGAQAGQAARLGAIQEPAAVSVSPQLSLAYPSSIAAVALVKVTKEMAAPRASAVVV
jgi:hypothetical protein